MNFRKVAGTLVVSLTLFPAPMLHAAPLNGIHLPTNALFGKTKMISLTFVNASQMPVTIKAGDQQITVQPGTTSALKLLAGTEILNVNATPTMTAGMVIATAGNNLNNATLTLR